MKAIWAENQSIRIRNDLPVPMPNQNEVLIRIRLAGICSTDLEIINGYYPFNGVLGHEFVGDVVQTQEAALEGKRVVGEINIGCDKCDYCKSGLSNHCIQRRVVGIKNHNGAFAEYMTLPTKNLHLVPDNIPDEVAVFTEPLAAALDIMNHVQVFNEDNILVIGAGRLGLLIAQSMKLTGRDIFVTSRNLHHKKLLKSWGIPMISIGDIPENGMSLVIEATGSSQGIFLARKAVRPEGTIVLKSTYKGYVSINLSSIVVDEVKLIGSRCGPFQPAIRLLAGGLVDTLSMVEDTYQLADGLTALDRAKNDGVLKILIAP